MAGKDLTYNVAVDASDAVGGLKKLEGAVKSTMKTVDSELDQGASAGDKFAASIDRLALQMKEDFDKAGAAAEALKTSLATVDSSIDVSDAIADLSKMGFTFDEIRADADQFAASLKQLDDVKLQGVKDLDAIAPGLKSKLDDVGKSADSSKSVLANMVGNATQDLGALGGVAGSAGVAIGQMGEYMADAASSGEGMSSIVKNFGAMVGPIAAISAATILVSGAMKSIADSKAFHKKEVQDFANAFRDGATFTEAISDDLRETEQIIGRADGVAGMFEDSKDIVKDLDAMGLTIEDITAALGGTDAQWQAFIGPMKADLADIKKEGGKGFLGLQTDEQMDDLNRLRDTVEILDEKRADYIKGAEEAAIKERFFGEAVDDTAEAVEEETRSFQRSKPVIDDNRAALDRHKDETLKARDAVDDLRTANQKLRDDLDNRETYLNLQNTFKDLKIVGGDTMAWIAAGGGEAEQAIRDFELQQIAAKDEVLVYLDTLEDIPPEKETEILALIDQGKYDEALAAIEELTKEQVVDVRFNVIRPRSLGVGTSGGGGVPIGLAAGATSFPTAAQIAKSIGTVRVPVDAFVRSTPRVTGIRN